MEVFRVGFAVRVSGWEVAIIRLFLDPDFCSTRSEQCDRAFSGYRRSEFPKAGGDDDHTRTLLDSRR
jgi:hypothetical protein